MKGAKGWHEEVSSASEGVFIISALLGENMQMDKLELWQGCAWNRADK